MIKYKNNQTVKFILPLITNVSPKLLVNDRFIGAFISDLDEPQYDGKVVLAYKYEPTVEWAKFEIKLMENDNFVTSYDYQQEGIVVYVFDIPEEKVDSVENILDGYYTKIDTIDKLEIAKFWFTNNEKSLVGKVLDEDHNDIMRVWTIIGRNHTEFCNDGEYWMKPIFTDEIFDKSNY